MYNFNVYNYNFFIVAFRMAFLVIPLNLTSGILYGIAKLKK